MSFRWRLFLGLVTTVLATAAVYALFGFVVFKRSQDLSVSRALSAFRQAVLVSLDLSGPEPMLRPSSASLNVLETYSDSGFRLLQDGRVLLEFGRFRSEPSPGWQLERVPLEGGYELRLALNIAENRNALKSYGQAALLALVLALGCAALIGWLLQNFLLRPLRELQRGVEELSVQAIPAPVVVPPGNDELNRLARSFNRMTASLKAFLERERSFTRYASHELRTPLANLKVLTEGLRKGILTPDDAWPQIGDSITRIERILTGLLSLSRTPNPRPEPVPLESVVTRVLHRLPPEQRSRLRLVRQSAPYVAGDEELLSGVLGNLVQNALKYSDGEVVVRLDRSLEGAILSVRDFGPGVPDAQLGKLSEPFFRLDKHKTGLGLGLALAKHTAAAFGGSLRFRNLRPGLEATLVLPELDLPPANEPLLSSSQVSVDA